MQKDKLRLMLIAAGTGLLLVTAVLYGIMAFGQRHVNPGDLAPLIIPLVLSVFMVFFLARRFRDVKQGMPLEDERSKKVMNRAAAVSFFISLYWLLAIGWFERLLADIFRLEYMTAGQATGVGIAGMAIIFSVCWLYYNKQNNI